MNAILPHLPALQVAVPLLGAVLVALMRRPGPAFAVALAVSWLMPVIAAALLWQVMAEGPISYHMGGWPPPIGIEYRVDLLNGFVLLLVSVVGAAIAPYAHRSVAFEIEEARRAWFYCMYLLCLTGLLGIAITGDAFNAFVFMEISSLSTYVLIALGRDRRGLLASFQYLMMGTIGATLYVIGVGFIYLVTGSLNMVDIAERLRPVSGETMRPVIAGLTFITVGISLKLALFPLHVWLPNAYAYGPSWATAFLAGTATKVAVYLIVRFFFSVFGVSLVVDGSPVFEVVIALSIVAMFIPSIVAVFENDLKRMLAYSSLAQIGYITLGIGLANANGLTGGLVHLFNHAIMKSALFLALGAVFLRAGTVHLDELAGIGRRMPITMTAFVVAGLGLIGTPGTAGFISKWFLGVGALDRGSWLILMLIVASSMIAVVYVGRVVEVVWFRPTAPGVEHATDPPLSMLVPLLVLSAATIYFGFDTQLTADIAQRAAEALLGARK